jgi:branched-chain amino acid transport system permease protein
MTTAAPPVLRSDSFRQSLTVSGLFVLGLLLVNVLLFQPGTVAIVLLSGLYQGMLFFLVAAGLSIVFGLLDVLNLAQGSFFMVGAYAGFAIYGLMPEGTPTELRFLAALVGATAIGAGLGALVETALLRPLYTRPVYQIVLTFGLATILDELVQTIYGPAGLVPIEEPAILSGSIPVLGSSFEVYRLFVIIVGFILMVSISLLLQRTRLGFIIRAGVQDPEMVQALGINIRRIFTLVFVLGAAVAALGGITAAPVIGANPGMGGQFLLTAIIVIVIGGMSSYEGTAIASLLVGLTRATTEQLSLRYFDTPVLATISILLFMVVVLLVKPNGLFGRE